jgi:hypothetical protein
MVAGMAAGIGAMSVTMLGLPLTSVLLATVLLSSDGIAVTPLVIVAVVVAYVCAARLDPRVDQPRQVGRGGAPGGTRSPFLFHHLRMRAKLPAGGVDLPEPGRGLLE